MTNVIVRTLILYACVVGALRMMGKRQIGELEPSELVVTIMISELAALPIQESGAPLLSSVVPIVILVCVELITSFLLLKCPFLRKVIVGVPNVIIKDGVVNRKELETNRVTFEELSEELRKQGVTDISTVKTGILETGGQLSVILKREHQPLTLKELKRHNSKENKDK